ncbi:MAG: thioredoxin-disulfide reductase [Acidimicrobiia bacterium]
MSEDRKVVILGSGPAGLTAAIYAARALLEPVVIEGIEAGGQLMLTTDVENYPGFPDGVMGPDLMTKLREQAVRFGAEFVTADADRVDLSEPPFGAWVGSTEYRGDAVILSTGASAQMLGLESEQRLLAKGVSTCATCDGFFFRGKPIGVVGGGDSAVEEALFLTKFATNVTVIHRRDELRASKIMAERAFANDKIDFKWNSTVEEVLGDQRVEGVRLSDTESGKESRLDLDGLFVAIGHTPNTDLVKGQIDLDDAGYVITSPDSTATSVDGVFAAGDVQDHVFRQAVTAAGSGCMAAIEAERWLAAREHG